MIQAPVKMAVPVPLMVSIVIVLLTFTAVIVNTRMMVSTTLAEV